jgi:glycosyltransferase involved in cell wall biosynthesis
MKICIVHNEYGKFSGEEAVVKNLLQLLKEQGHQVRYFNRSSAEIQDIRIGKFLAFFSGLYSFSSRKMMRRCLKEFKPDIVHIHNLFPFISPSVLGVCRSIGVPVVMTVHNYRLICPTGLHLSYGRICEKCRNGNEYWCVLKNCEKNIFKSIGYALRNAVARKLKLFKKNVSLYICLSDFQRQKLIRDGFPVARCEVLPNMIGCKEKELQVHSSDYVGYVGRVSPEKGVSTLLEVAQKYPTITFRAAGSYEKMPYLPSDSPDNFRFLGHLQKDATNSFFSESKIIVLCSVWYEGFPMILVEAMLHGKPVIASRIGGIPEIVEDGITGLLFEPGNADDLGKKIEYLWDQPELCKKMGAAGRQKASKEYSADVYYNRLMSLYDKARKTCNN